MGLGRFLDERSVLEAPTHRQHKQNSKYRRNEMFMKLNVWVLGIALPVITSASAYPQVAPWSTFPGSTTVGGSFDRETIRGGTGAGTFRAVQLRVVGGPVKVDRLVVR
jgi:hypothetical protein